MKFQSHSKFVYGNLGGKEDSSNGKMYENIALLLNFHYYDNFKIFHFHQHSLNRLRYGVFYV